MRGAAGGSGLDILPCDQRQQRQRALRLLIPLAGVAML
jgi:hypothetical protein